MSTVSPGPWPRYLPEDACVKSDLPPETGHLVSAASVRTTMSGPGCHHAEHQDISRGWWSLSLSAWKNVSATTAATVARLPELSGLDSVSQASEKPHFKWKCRQPHRIRMARSACGFLNRKPAAEGHTLNPRLLCLGRLIERALLHRDRT